MVRRCLDRGVHRRSSHSHSQRYHLGFLGYLRLFPLHRGSAAQQLFDMLRKLLRNLESYDLGFWSLYEQSGTRLKMVASPFYHRLHIVQLRIMYRLTGEYIFRDTRIAGSAMPTVASNGPRALCYKSAFKLCYY